MTQFRANESDLVLLPENADSQPVFMFTPIDSANEPVMTLELVDEHDQHN